MKKRDRKSGRRGREREEEEEEERFGNGGWLCHREGRTADGDTGTELEKERVDSNYSDLQKDSQHSRGETGSQRPQESKKMGLEALRKLRK